LRQAYATGRINQVAISNVPEIALENHKDRCANKDPKISWTHTMRCFFALEQAITELIFISMN